MDRCDIIQYLSKKINAKNYLEIGIANGETFSKIDVENKIGIDPEIDSKATVHLTSDDFFKSNQKSFDLIFIDGLHESHQVEKDIINSLNFLNPSGYIICHDMLPTSFEMQAMPRKQGVWTGDCWKAWVKIRNKDSQLTMRVVNTDYGCGIICRGEQKLVKINEELSYKNFVKNKMYWMNIISVDQFKEFY